MALQRNSKQKKDLLVAGIMALGIAGLFLVLFYVFPNSAGSWIHLVERKTLDSYFKKVSRHLKADPTIVIITINDEALNVMQPRYGRWPWPRRAMGEIVEYLHHVGARVIGIDVLYPEVNLSDPAGDRFFVQQVKSAGNVILAANYSATNDPLLPFGPLYQACSGTGGIDFTADPDGPTRRYRLLYPREDGIHPGLALAMAQFLKTPIDWTHLPLDHYNSYRINWYGPQGQFTYIGANKVLEAYQEWKQNPHDADLHEEASQFLKNKIVLVGVTATGLFDLRANPYSPIYPGIEVHATALSNLIRGDFIHSLPMGWGIFYLFLVGFASAGAGILLRSPLKESLFALGIISLIFLFGTQSFARDYWVPTALPLMTVLGTVMATLFWNYLTTGKEKRFIRQAFARYINEEVLDVLLNDPEKLQLGGENVNVTVLFSDIRNFTSLSENRPPDEVVAWLNEYLTEMVDIVFHYQGTLDKFIGDAIMAFWGAPIKTPNHPDLAVQAGIAMLKKVEELRARWQQEGKPESGKPELRIGIGINSAEMTVGNIGSERSQSYTVIGDGVNLASRLETLNKTYATSMIVSEFTYERVKEKVVARFLDEVKVKGKEKSVKIYEVTDWRGADTPPFSVES